MSSTNVKKLKRGKMFIFNMYNLASSLEPVRSGSNKDVEKLTDSFGRRNTDVEFFPDFTQKELTSKMEEIKNQDFTQYDYVVIVFCSHGHEDSRASTVDGQNIYLQRTLMIPMLKNVTLSKKLKWLITQTCRGQLQLVPEHGKKKTGEGEPFIDQKYYLISYSACEGFISIRDPDAGALYIQSLCEELDALKCDEDIISFLNRVSEKVKTLAFARYEEIQQPSIENNFGDLSFQIVVDNKV